MTTPTMTKALTSLVLSSLILTTASCASEDHWRSLSPQNTVLMTLPQGYVVIELAPQFSPKHVAQFSQLVKNGTFNGNKFYRVIDGFVAQGGPDESIAEPPTLKMESEWQTDQHWSYTKVQDNDLFAEQTGFKDGFAIGRDLNTQTAWLTHCPGVIAMARAEDPNSGSNQFYFPIGQAPRYLDRIMTIFGRVVYGMEHIQSIQRTQAIEGDTAVDSSKYTPILAMQLMADVPKDQQLIVEVEDTATDAFAQKISDRIERKDAFFYKKPPKVLDICQTPVKSRVLKAR